MGSSIQARLAEFRMRGSQREIEYQREVEAQLAEVQRDLRTLGERLAGHRDTSATQPTSRIDGLLPHRWPLDASIRARLPRQDGIAGRTWTPPVCQAISLLAHEEKIASVHSDF